MHQRLRGFVAERVSRKESILKSLNAGLEEAFYLVIQIEKVDAKEFSNLFTDRRLSDTTDTRKKYSHLHTFVRAFDRVQTFEVSRPATDCAICTARIPGRLE